MKLRDLETSVLITIISHLHPFTSIYIHLHSALYSFVPMAAGYDPEEHLARRNFSNFTEDAKRVRPPILAPILNKKKTAKLQWCGVWMCVVVQNVP